MLPACGISSYRRQLLLLHWRREPLRVFSCFLKAAFAKQRLWISALWKRKAKLFQDSKKDERSERIRVSFETHTSVPPHVPTCPVREELLRSPSRVFSPTMGSVRESDNHERMEEAFAKCEWKWEYIWYYTDSIILLTGVLANAAMLWFLLWNKNAFTASQVSAARVITLQVGPRRPSHGLPGSPLLTSDHQH